MCNGLANLFTLTNSDQVVTYFGMKSVDKKLVQLECEILFKQPHFECTLPVGCTVTPNANDLKKEHLHYQFMGQTIVW